MAHRSQCSSAGDNPMDPNYLPPHYREEYRLAIDALVEHDIEGYYEFLQRTDVVDFLSNQEIKHIRCTVQVPYQNTQSDLPYVQPVADGSSDTYWPVHSDLDVPGLDLGWPQQHRVIGPTEVTTLINPSEPDMPSIKEQARRLIKNAQQVIAVVMDIFTDVDIFYDILDAAMRNVAVYIILDEHNAQHFVSMASNCRVDLKNIECMRVRTVSGVTYRCRSGKSFKGQMMDRFLLTDCRAVLSGNYSFMWSFEKIHRCMAHLFLGQLVTTFDEEFRILFAHSEPLIPENVCGPVPYSNSEFDSQYITDRTPLFRDPRKLLPIDSSHSIEWARHSMEDQRDMVQKMTPLGKRETIYLSQNNLPQDTYSDKYSSKHLRLETDYFTEQGLPMNLPNTKEFTGSKRHGYAGGPLARNSASQLMQHQDVHSFERSLAMQSRNMQREQHYYQRPEPGYGVYDQFRGQGSHQREQHYYPESGYPYGIAIVPPDNYDPILNYLSSSNLAVEIDHGSDKLSHSRDIQKTFAQSNSRRHSVGQPYVCQTSPKQMNISELKQFVVGSDVDRKTNDPSAKQGMRDWRISSFLSACDDAEVDIPQPLVTSLFEEPLNTSEAKWFAPLVSHSRFSAKELNKTPELRLNKPKNTTPDIFDNMATDARTTPTTPSEKSSITEGDKSEEIVVKEGKQEESFRRKLNPVIQRTSRLRSSLIFSSQLEQNNSQELTSDQHCEETTEEDNQSKLSMATFGKRRSFREPFAWSINKSGTIGNLTNDSLKSEDTITDSGDKVLPNLVSSNEQPKPVDEKQTTQSSHPSRSAQVEQPKPAFLEQSSLSSTSFINMNDPDIRLQFFKELAAKRKAKKASESENSTEKASVKPEIPFDLEIKDPNSRVEPTISAVPINQADLSTKNPVASKEGGLEPADTSTKMSAKLTRAQLCPANISIEKPDPSTEAQFNTSIKLPATSIEASLNPADTFTEKQDTSTQTLNKKSAQTKNTSLNQSDSVIKTEALPVSHENKTSMATCDSLHLAVKEHASKNKDFDTIDIHKSDSKIFLSQTSDDDLPTVFTDTEKIEIGSKVTSGDTSGILNRTSKQHNFNVTLTDFSLNKLSLKEPKLSNLPSLKCAAKDSSPPLFSTHKGTSLSNPMSNPPYPPSKHTIVEFILPQSPIQFESSISPHPVPSNSTTSPSIIPLQSSTLTIPGSAEPVVPLNQNKMDSMVSLGPMTSWSSLITDVPTKLSLPPSPNQTESTSLPKSTLFGSNPSTPMESNTISKPSTNDSSSTIELKSTSSKTNTITSDSELELSQKPSKTPKHPNSTSTQSSDSSSTSLSSSKSITEESDTSLIFTLREYIGPPELTPKELSVSSNLPSKEPINFPNTILIDASASPIAIPIESSASPDSISKESSASPGQTATESSASPGQTETESSASPGQTATESSASPGQTATESSASPGQTATESSASPGQTATESSASPGQTATESSASLHPITIEPSVSLDSLPKESSASPGPTASESSAYPAPVTIESSITPGNIQTASSESQCHTESNASPGLGQSESHPSLGITATELTASPGSSQTNSSVSLVTIPTESSVPPCPTSIASLGPSQPVSGVTPGFLPAESSTAPGPSQLELSASPVPHIAELRASTLPSQTDSSISLSAIPMETSTSQDDSQTEPSEESSAFSCPNPTASILSPSPNQTYSIQSPDSIPTESGALPGTSPTESSALPGTSPTESCGCLGPIPAESGAYPGYKKTGDPETISKTAPEQSFFPGTQSPGETKENNTTIKSESKIPPVKQSKIGQAHYYSSTANVLSSSNLRDDTKLLLEQISANSQSRTEITKESAVTDDAKQDQVDRGVSTAEETSARQRGRVIVTSRTAEDREKLLQRIESMRKERKVYSRFEMPP